MLVRRRSNTTATRSTWPTTARSTTSTPANRSRDASKYVANSNGTLVHNVITGQPILKTLAIEIPSSTGLVRTYDAVGLYKWFIEMKKTELTGFIPHLTRAQRRRIKKLYAVYKKMQAQRVAFQRKHAIKGTRFVNNAAVVGMKLLNMAMYVVVFLLLSYMKTLHKRGESIWWSKMYGAYGAALPPIVKKGSALLKNTMKRAFVKKKLAMVKAQLERHIDGIPMRGSDIRTFEYILSVAKDFEKRRTGGAFAVNFNASVKANIGRIANKLRELNLLV